MSPRLREPLALVVACIVWDLLFHDRLAGTIGLIILPVAVIWLIMNIIRERKS